MPVWDTIKTFIRTSLVSSWVFVKSTATEFVDMRDYVFWRFTAMSAVIIGFVFFGLGLSYRMAAKRWALIMAELDPDNEFQYMGYSCEITYAHWRPHDYAEKRNKMEMQVCDDVWIYEFTVGLDIANKGVCCTNVLDNNWYTDPCLDSNSTECGGSLQDVYVSVENRTRKCYDCECNLQPSTANPPLRPGDVVPCWLSKVEGRELREEYKCDRRQALCAKLDDPFVVRERVHSELLTQRRKGRLFSMMGSLMCGISTFVMTVWFVVPSNNQAPAPNPVAVRAEG